MDWAVLWTLGRAGSSFLLRPPSTSTDELGISQLEKGLASLDVSRADADKPEDKEDDETQPAVQEELNGMLLLMMTAARMKPHAILLSLVLWGDQ